MRLRARSTVTAVVLLLLTACSGSGSGSGGSTPSATPPGTDSVAPVPGPVSYPDWPTYHGDTRRSGVAATMPPATQAEPDARVKLDGAVYASPLVVTGRIIAATENDSVYALGPSGRQLWKTTLGTPSAQKERPCGDIAPLGITGTPIYLNGTVYVVAELGAPVRHDLVALDVETGAVQWRRSVDLPGVDATVMQQRGALTIASGRVWVSFGALAGDCGDYKGRIVGSTLAGTGALVSYTVPTARGGGMWNPSGPAVDAAGDLYVTTANGASGPGQPYDHANSILKLGPTAALLDSYAPSDWAENSAQDVGLGSQGPALVGTQWVVVGGKSGPIHVLRQSKLGGIGGQVSDLTVCTSYGGAAVAGDVVYLPCTDGVRAVQVSSTGTLSVLWHADQAVSGAPVVGGGVVWALSPNDGVLHGLDLLTGRSRYSVAVGAVSRFATPALSGPIVVVPTMDGVVSVRVVPY